MKTKSTSLRWHTDLDENGNTICEAVGGSTDGESTDLSYRIKQVLQDDAHWWVEASDAELMMDEDTPMRWHSVFAAQAAMQAWHDQMWTAYKAATAKTNATT